MTPNLTRLRALLINRASDPAVQQWHAQHANDTHPPCDRCGSAQSLTVRACSRCTFVLCPRCYLKHLFTRSTSRSLCTSVIEWATFHAAFRQDNPDAEPSAEDFAAARDAMRGYLR
jgi:hypothetical protein